MRLGGAGGSTFVVQARGSWQIDFGHAQLSGGVRYAGIALELLGRPAKDGLVTILASLPDTAGSRKRHRVALGAVDEHGLSVQMPAGRYLLVLVGDGQIMARLPLTGAASVSAPIPFGTREMAFVQGSATARFAPRPVGLYEGDLSMPLPVYRDPLVMTEFSYTLSSGPQVYDAADCITTHSGGCSHANSPTFGTAAQTTGGDSSTADSYYDSADGITTGNRPRAYVADYRGSRPFRAMSATVLVVSGANH